MISAKSFCKCSEARTISSQLGSFRTENIWGARKYKLPSALQRVDGTRVRGGETLMPGCVSSLPRNEALLPIKYSHRDLVTSVRAPAAAVRYTGARQLLYSVSQQAKEIKKVNWYFN